MPNKIITKYIFGMYYYLVIIMLVAKIAIKSRLKVCSTLRIYTHNNIIIMCIYPPQILRTYSYTLTIVTV